MASNSRSQRHPLLDSDLHPIGAELGRFSLSKGFDFFNKGLKVEGRKTNQLNH